MIVKVSEEEMGQHLDEMRAHHIDTSQDDQNIMRRQTKRVMNLDELNEREIQQIQLCKRESNQGQVVLMG